MATRLWPAALLLAACAGGAPEATMRTPDWNGPAVHCRQLADGGLVVELVAPTAGHRFALVDVRRDGATAEVHCDYAPPTGDLVAQVISPLPVDVPAAALGDATSVQVWIRGGDAPRLALALARPPR